MTPSKKGLTLLKFVSVEIQPWHKELANATEGLPGKVGRGRRSMPTLGTLNVKMVSILFVNGLIEFSS